MFSMSDSISAIEGLGMTDIPLMTSTSSLCVILSTLNITLPSTNLLRSCLRKGMFFFQKKFESVRKVASEKGLHRGYFGGLPVIVVEAKRAGELLENRFLKILQKGVCLLVERHYNTNAPSPRSEDYLLDLIVSDVLILHLLSRNGVSHS